MDVINHMYGDCTWHIALGWVSFHSLCPLFVCSVYQNTGFSSSSYIFIFSVCFGLVNEILFCKCNCYYSIVFFFFLCFLLHCWTHQIAYLLTQWVWWHKEKYLVGNRTESRVRWWITEPSLHDQTRSGCCCRVIRFFLKWGTLGSYLTRWSVCWLTQWELWTSSTSAGNKLQIFRWDINLKAEWDTVRASSCLWTTDTFTPLHN